MEESDGPPCPAWFVALLLVAFAGSSIAAPTDTLGKVHASGRLTYGSDEEGGAPYIYHDRNPPNALIGFEVELMERVGRAMGVRAEFRQALWENLLQVLDVGDFDVVVNGYELTELRAQRYLSTRPYYLFQLQLMALPGASVRSLADLNMPRPGGGPWQVGVLGNSTADAFARRLDPKLVRVVRFEGATNAMLKVRTGQLDATLQDLPAARYFVKQPEFSGLALAGPPEGCGYYVMYVRRGDEALRDALDAAIGAVIASGELRSICEKYDAWNTAQDVLSRWTVDARRDAIDARPAFDPGLLRNFFPTLLRGALATVILSCASMPIAIAIGLALAVGRLYGPRWVSIPLGAYVELIRGTPLLLQLSVLYFVLPELGFRLSPWTAGIAGLAINYSAYEAEIYRAGLQAIPRGQMEAALALGMSRSMALRRVIVPQAVRIVIPPVTSDFIALFKDTSVCSVITITELTKTYSILWQSVGGVVEFGIATSLLYLAMSLPLSWFSKWVERRLDADSDRGALKP